MKEKTYADAALLLAGHGSGQNRDSGRTVVRQAAALRDWGLFADVREGFLRQEPFLAEVSARVARSRVSRVFVVPMFISEGYFSEQVIPRELGLRGDGQSDFERMQVRGGQTIHYCRPIGTHERMTSVLEARARQVVRQHPFPVAPRPQETALLIAGHGTPRDANSRKSIERQVELLRVRNAYGEVHGAFLEEEPRIADCYEFVAARNLVVVPFFMSDGLHVHEDIPVLLGEPDAAVQERLRQGCFPWRNPTERRGKRVWYSESIGSEPLIAEVILERVREAAGENVRAAA